MVVTSSGNSLCHALPRPKPRRAPRQGFMSDPDLVSDMITLWTCAGDSPASLALDLDATTELIAHRKSIQCAKDRLC
jgi:hypothetical protein